MNDGQQAGAADVLASIGRHWGWIMAFGVLTLLAGVAVLAWPGRTLVVIAVLFGVQLIVTGIFRFVAAFAADDLTGGTRVLLAVLGVLSLIVGLYAVRHVLVTLLALALLLGIFWIVNGSVELFMALSHREMANRGWPRNGHLEHFRRHHSPGVSRHIAAGAGGRTQRLAAFLRRNGDHHGVPASVPRPPGQKPIFGGISVALAKRFKFTDAELKAAHRRTGTDVQPLPATDLNRHRPGAGTEQPRGGKEQTCCKPGLT